jgi:serine/threonine protein phosphatase PrpC
MSPRDEGPPIRVAVGAATHEGLRRRINEDAHLARSPLFLVADGMGGHDAGDIASAAVIDEFAALPGASVTVDHLQEALERARVRVDALRAGERAAGTTLSGVAIADIDGDGYWLTLNVGDSRTYRFFDGVLEQISVDHSVVQELVDSGALDEGDAASDSRRNVITRAIGAGSTGEADFWLIPAEAGDRMLVCSDGLSGELDAQAIADILAGVRDPQLAANRLVHEAILRGGRDNITAIVVDALEVSTRNAGEDHDTRPPVPADDGPDIDTETRPRAAASEGAR